MERAKVYSETLAVLEVLGDEFKNKIPKSLYNKINREKSQYYFPKFDKNIKLNNQKINKDTVAFLSFLHYSYWCENQKEKNTIKNILLENENAYQDLIKIELNEDMFKKEKENKELTVIEEKKSLFDKIKNFIKGILGDKNE